MNRIRWYGPTIVLAVTVLLVMVLGPGMVRHLAWAQRDAKIQLIRTDLAENQSLAELSRAFRAVGQVVEPSVVYIQVSRRTAMRERGMRGMPPGVPEEGPWRWFFGPRGEDPFEEDLEQREVPPRGGEDLERFNVPRPYGSGSGWVYDANGHIVTNNHVISGAEIITVRFADGTEREASVVGIDPKTDIAVIKVPGDNLHPASLAREPAEQGDIVFAFGSPFRFEFSMSQGIVSAKGRELGIISEGAQRGYENFIQTDAAINPGNSGGPLTNIYGQVVGMNTAIASRTGAYMGLGFAIPVDMIQPVVDQILQTGRVTRGYLGIYIDDLDPRMARTFKFEGRGVLVSSPIPGGPGEAAGIQRGDIITKIDGQEIASAQELRRVVAAYAPGAKFPVDLFRNGKSMTVDVTVAEQPTEIAVGPGTAPRAPTPAAPQAQEMELLRKIGLEAISALTPEVATQLRMDFVPGVLIRDVRPASAADAAGLSRGLVITEVMGNPVSDPQNFAAELSKHNLAEGVRLTVVERGVTRFVLLEFTQQQQQREQEPQR